MKTILKIAWRNIWRNRLRSLVVIGSIVLGIWSGVAVGGFSFGLNAQRTRSMINNNLSHIQIHNKHWQEEQKLNYWLNEPSEVEDFLQSSEQVKSFTNRVLINGMIASAHYTSGIKITGIDPASEARVTGLESKVDSGKYIGEKGRNPILIGMALAEKMDVRIGSKVVITFTDESGNIISSAFKVRGIYDVTSSQQEKMQVFVRNTDLLNLIGREEGSHEVALLLKNEEDLAAFKDQLKKQFPNSDIRSWKELAPELAYADELMSTMLYIIIGIIMMALSFGIINTMLMSVLERRKELGMLMGVGMSKTRLFFMILFETLLLAICGGPLGILLGYITIRWTGATGIDLGVFGKGLESLGMESIIYPEVVTSFYFGTAAIVMIMALVSSIWPARRALKMNPVEAIRTI